MRNFRHSVTIAAVALLPVILPAQQGVQIAHPAWSRSAVLYEVNIRQYTPEGTLAAFERQLPRLDSLGVDVLWLMPVQPIGVKNRKGILGSYYSVQNYTAVNPEYGTAADFRRLVDDIHRRRKHVILDWVPNHSSFDNVWVAPHPDWYLHKADGTIMNARDNEDHETDWTDVAELDYSKPALRTAMIAAMRWWVDSMHVDGFRCDVAGGVPMDFWLEARRALATSRRDLFMLAEAEGPKYHAAFDATYGWEFHHLLNDVAQGKDPASVIGDYLARNRAQYPVDADRMYFTSNHDENSWNGTEFERMGQNHRVAFVVAATIQNSLPLLYTGQEASLSKRLRFFEKDTVDWRGPSLAQFYRSMFDLKHANVALSNGAEGGDQLRLETNGGPGVYAFTRTRGANTVLVAVNFASGPATVSYNGLPRPGDYTDWFGKSRLSLGKSGTLDIPANGYRVLVR